jgi:tellurite resistance protein TehA-like permease
MTECMNMPGMGWMMWGMGLFWLLVIVALVLAIAASIKYLRSGRPDTARSGA